MKTVAIVQARLGSTRLPGKVLMNLAGKPMIIYMLDRIRLCRLVDEIILATGDTSKDDLLAETVQKYGYMVHRGPEDDVLSRYYGAAEKAQADLVIRLTGDCPLMDPTIVDRLVEIALKGKYDYLSNFKPPTFPDGLDVSVFTIGILNQAHMEAKLKSQREHVVPWMWKNSNVENGDRYKAFNMEHVEDLSIQRWTVDMEEDLKFIEEVIAKLDESKKQTATMHDILEVLKKYPELLKINKEFERDASLKKDLQREQTEKA